MAYKPIQQEMYYQFNPKVSDQGQQSYIRGQYQSLSYQLDGLPDGPEKSVAFRKLLESMDAALRCYQA